jgi:hypothetical protein
MSVRVDAAAALAAREVEVAAQEAADRQALEEAVVPVLRQVLATADGTLAVPLSSLTQDVVDLGDRLVVVTDGSSDPSVSLAVQDVDGDGVWDTHLVGLVDGGWTKLSGPLGTLADVGQALATREA